MNTPSTTEIQDQTKSTKGIDETGVYVPGMDESTSYPSPAMLELMNHKTLHQLILSCAEKKADGYFKALAIRTKNGNIYEGSFSHWNTKESPALVCVTDSRGMKTYFEKDSIESIAITG